MSQIKTHYEKFKERLLPIGLIFLLDIFLTCLSFAASYAICANFFPGIDGYKLVVQLPVIIAVSSLIFLTIGIYKNLVEYGSLRQAYSIFNAICLANILTIVFAVVNGKLMMEEDLGIPLSIILVHSVLSFIALIASRFLYKNLLLAVKDRLEKSSNIILIHNIKDENHILNDFSLTIKQQGKSVVKTFDFLGEDFEKELDANTLKKYAADAFMLLLDEQRPVNFDKGLEKLINFGRPIYFGYAKDGVSSINTSFDRLSIAHVFGPQLDYKNNRFSLTKEFDRASLLVSGAGGVIAKEYIDSVLASEFKGKLILVDNSEKSLSAITSYCALFKGVEVVSRLGNIKEASFIEDIFKEHRPKYVLHAAGNNKPEVFDDGIVSIFKENLLATKTLADIAARYNVNRFVFCSSKEAEKPGSTLEVCKRVSEIYLASLNNTKNPFRFVSIRLNKVFDLDNFFINQLRQQIDMGETPDLSRTEPFKVFSNKKDVAYTLLHMTTESNPPSSVFASKLGVKVKTESLVRLMKSFRFKSSVKNTGERKDAGLLLGISGNAKMGLSTPPLDPVWDQKSLSNTEIKQVVNTLCLNVQLNAKEYPEVFALVQDFDKGYWKAAFDLYNSRNSNKEVIRLGQ